MSFKELTSKLEVDQLRSKFKRPARVSGSVSNARPPSKSNGHVLHPTKLGPFASMVLNATALAPQCKSPRSQPCNDLKVKIVRSHCG